MRGLVIALAALSFGLPAALADSTPIPPTTSLPWTDPAHQSGLELLAGQIASRIVGHPVGARCEGENDWNALAAESGFDPSVELGYVTFFVRTSGGVSVGDPYPATFTELSPTVCLALQQFALAATKPTKCSRATTERTTLLVKRTVRVTRRVPVRVRVGGKVVVRIVPKTLTETRTVPQVVERRVASPPQPCYADGDAIPGQSDLYWSTYSDHAQAILTLAHEAIHLGGDQSEARAECYGMQRMAEVAVQLGDTPDDAEGIAQFIAERLYPQLRKTAPTYWSADCVPGGALDVRADHTGAWP